MNDKQLDAVLRAWMEEESAPKPDRSRVVGDVVGQLGAARKTRRRWWPFGRHAAPPPTTGQVIDPQPKPIPATDGQSPTFTGRTQSMLSPAKVITAGALVFALGGVVLIAQPFDQQGGSVPGAATGGPGTFGPAGSLTEARFAHTAVRLADGRVLIVGGSEHDQETLIASAEVWDPETATFGPAGSMAQARREATGTLLPDGRVLIVGGWSADDDDGPNASAEIWDPSMETFEPAGSLTEGVSVHTATLLPDGRVVIVGREDIEGAPVLVETWDPATESFSPAGSLVEALDGLSATLLSDGRVLLLGESTGDDPEDDSDDLLVAHFWDPVTGSSSPAGTLAGGPSGHIALLLPDGRVLIVDAFHDSDFPAHVWDPETESFSRPGSLAASMSNIETATLLSDGRVLYLGTSNWGVMSAEIWDPATGSLGPAGPFHDPRTRIVHTATLLPDGRVLIVGGGNRDGLVEVAEVWEPGSG